MCFGFRLHHSSGQVDGQNTAHDQTLPVPTWWSYHYCAGEYGIPLSAALQHLHWKITCSSCSSWRVGGEWIWQLLRMWLQLPASPGQAVPVSPWWQGGAVHHRWSRDRLPQVWLDTRTVRHCWLWARWVLPSNMLYLSVQIYKWSFRFLVFWVFTSESRLNVHDFPFLILLGSNVTAAFEAQRHAEPHGPLVNAQICTFDPFINCVLIWGTYVVFTGELWVLHRLAGPLGVTSLCCAIYCRGKVAQRDSGCGSKRQHVC